MRFLCCIFNSIFKITERIKKTKKKQDYAFEIGINYKTKIVILSVFIFYPLCEERFMVGYLNFYS